MEALFTKILDNLPLYIVIGVAVIWAVVYATIKGHNFYLKLSGTITKTEAHGEVLNKFADYLVLMQDMKASIRKIEEYIIKQNPLAIEDEKSPV